jgi:2-succinyl-6-hydroxy-2,4-cyclohexadiene-1-carboxylate synthase
VRPAIVLLHGFTQTRQSWRRTVQALGGRYRALTPDLPGHGHAAERRPASFAAMTAYIRALAPDDFTLAGYSMGGRIALHVALTLRPRRLVLIGASPGLRDPAERAARRRADDDLAARIERQSIEEFAEQWAAQPLFQGQPDRVRAAAHADRLRNTPHGLAAALRGLGTGVMEPLWDRLPGLTMPVTLIVGQRDTKYTAIATEMAKRLPDARLVIVPGAGHAVHLESPEAVAAAVTDDDRYQLGSSPPSS